MEVLYISINITPDEITICSIHWRQVLEEYEDLGQYILQIDQRPNETAWEMIRPLISQALDGLGLDFAGIDLSGVTSCRIWLGERYCGDNPTNPNQWRLKLNLANGREIQGGLGVGPESQVFRESLVSYLTHPNILGFKLKAGQFSPVQDNQDVNRLVGEIQDALQARKEAQEKSQGDGPKLPPGRY